MPIKAALESSGKFLSNAAEAAKPEIVNNPTAPTVKDYSTATIAGSVTVLLVAALHHGANVDLSPEVTAAGTTGRRIHSRKILSLLVRANNKGEKQNGV